MRLRVIALALLVVSATGCVLHWEDYPPREDASADADASDGRR